MLVREYCAMVNYGASIPPYRQIEAILRERIADGTYEPGQRLPGTRALMQEFGVAQFTAQKALRELVKDGTAVSTQGLGTYVADDIDSAPSKDESHE